MSDYPAINQLNLSTPITIGNKDGTNGVAFSGMKEPPVLPELQRLRSVKLTSMSTPELGTPGWRVVEAYRTNENQYDVEWESNFVTPAEVARLRAYVQGADPDDPGLVVFTLGAAAGDTATYYTGVMAENYPQVENYRYNLRTFHKVRIKIHSLGLSNVTSITVPS